MGRECSTHERMRNVYGKHERMTSRRWEDNTKMHLKEIKCERGVRINCAQDKSHWRVLVNIVPVTSNLWSIWATAGFSRRTCSIELVNINIFVHNSCIWLWSAFMPPFRCLASFLLTLKLSSFRAAAMLFYILRKLRVLGVRDLH